MKVLVFIFLIFIPNLMTLMAGESKPGEFPIIRSKSALLMDASTGTVLYEKNADLAIPPASLTKLMTIHIVLEGAAKNEVRLDDMVELPPETWAINQPCGSSLMFLAPGQRVRLHELLLGLAVSSGNDAAIAVALHMSPSIDAFSLRMNEEAKKLGLWVTHFMEPSGISEFNMTTASEFARFCRYYIERHPEALTAYHSVREFSYPKPENLPEAFRDSPGTVRQYNRNLLLDSIEGVDGLKTGFIIESGYNLALTAERDMTRLIAVLLGGPGSSSTQGGQVRAEDGEALLSWGFKNYKTLRPKILKLSPQRVWKGREDYINLVPAEPLEFTVPRERAQSVQWKLERFEPVIAPVNTDMILGNLILYDEVGELRHIPLTAESQVLQGGFFKKIRDSIWLFFHSLGKRIFS